MKKTEPNIFLYKKHTQRGAKLSAKILFNYKILSKERFLRRISRSVLTFVATMMVPLLLLVVVGMQKTYYLVNEG